jgi:hypothetical protein
VEDSSEDHRRGDFEGKLGHGAANLSAGPGALDDQFEAALLGGEDLSWTACTASPSPAECPVDVIRSGLLD